MWRTCSIAQHYLNLLKNWISSNKQLLTRWKGQSWQWRLLFSCFNLPGLLKFSKFSIFQNFLNRISHVHEVINDVLSRGFLKKIVGLDIFVIFNGNQLWRSILHNQIANHKSVDFAKKLFHHMYLLCDFYKIRITPLKSIKTV